MGKRPAAGRGYAAGIRTIVTSVETSARSVLVVDDDRSIRFLCRVNLELEGWTVREAGSLAAARDQLADGVVSVVLLDVHVGSENGVAFLDEIRRDHPPVRVAMLTGSVGSPTLDGVVPDDIITKPFTIEQLLRTVEGLTSPR
jgi:DNA-binding NtrC family response regulator